MPAKKGCTYSRDLKGKCRSAEQHYAHEHGPRRKKGCSYGKHNGKCLSKKAAAAREKSARMHMAAYRISKALKKKKSRRSR